MGGEGRRVEGRRKGGGDKGKVGEREREREGGREGGNLRT